MHRLHGLHLVLECFKGAQYQRFCSMQASIHPLSTSHRWKESADINSGIKAHGCYVYRSQDMQMILDYRQVLVVVEMHSGTMDWSLKGFKLGCSGVKESKANEVYIF